MARWGLPFLVLLLPSVVANGDLLIAESIQFDFAAAAVTGPEDAVVLYADFDTGGLTSRRVSGESLQAPRDFYRLPDGWSLAPGWGLTRAFVADAHDDRVAVAFLTSDGDGLLQSLVVALSQDAGETWESDTLPLTAENLVSGTCCIRLFDIVASPGGQAHVAIEITGATLLATLTDHLWAIQPIAVAQQFVELAIDADGRPTACISEAGRVSLWTAGVRTLIFDGPSDSLYQCRVAFDARGAWGVISHVPISTTGCLRIDMDPGPVEVCHEAFSPEATRTFEISNGTVYVQDTGWQILHRPQLGSDPSGRRWLMTHNTMVLEVTPEGFEETHPYFGWPTYLPKDNMLSPVVVSGERATSEHPARLYLSRIGG